MKNTKLSRLLLFITMLMWAVGAQCETPFMLPLPEVPSSLTEPSERAAFVALHYWDGMDWNNSDLLNSEEFMGESMATFGTLLSIAGPERAKTIVNDFIARLSGNQAGLTAAANYSYSYFYAPESPYYNEDIFRMFVDNLLKTSGLPDLSKEKLLLYNTYLNKNRLGEKAADFEYIGEDGKKKHLLSTARDSDLKLLIFYDPDCHVCEETFEIISDSEILNQKVLEGKISVIAINAFGQSAPGAALRKQGMQAQWIVGYSPNGDVDENEIYAIRSIPTIYLLDKNYKVIDKDMSLERLKEFVQNPDLIQ